MRPLKFLALPVAMVIAFVIADPKPAQSVYSSPVSVVNTPLPVAVASGTVVGIDPANNTVKLGTIPVPVHDVDRLAQQPFQAEITLESGPNNPYGGSNSFTVPDGYRLVIESVSFHAQARTRIYQQIDVFTVATGSAGEHSFPVQNLGFNFSQNANLYAFSQATKLYADPGSQVYATASVNTSSTFDDFGSLTISGYLVSVN